MSPGRAFSVQSKLLVAFVVLTMATIAVLTTVGYFTARQSLTDGAERHLVSLQRSKAGVVKTMLTSLRNDVLALSAADVVVRSAVDARAAYHDLAGATVTPEMTEAVKRFYAEEFEPAVAKHLAVVPAEGASLPTTPSGGTCTITIS
jgi:hypothetical protein